MDPMLQAALEAIPKGQLSERQMRIAAGISLIRDQGRPYREVSAEVGIPPATLWRHMRRMPEAHEDQGVAINERALVAASFDVSQLAAERITERLLDDEAAWSNGDLVKAYGVATDKIALRRRWKDGDQRTTSEEGVTAIAKLLQGARITVEPIDPSERAIDVSPVE